MRLHVTLLVLRIDVLKIVNCEWDVLKTVIVNIGQISMKILSFVTMVPKFIAIRCIVRFFMNP